MELPIPRRQNCQRCQIPFLVCSRCDHGQRYCGPTCARAARRDSLRAAGTRYQKSRKGRHTHAARQRRYRERVRQKQKVTHQGSPPAIASGGIASSSETTALLPRKDSWNCHFCGCPCAQFIRIGFPRRRRTPRTIFRSPRGAQNGHFP